MADGAGGFSGPAQQNSGQFPPPNSFQPRDFRSVHSHTLPPDRAASTGHFQGGTGSQIYPSFPPPLSEFQRPLHPPRDAFTNNPGLSQHPGFVLNQGNLPQQMNAFSNSNNTGSFRPAGVNAQPRYNGPSFPRFNEFSRSLSQNSGPSFNHPAQILGSPTHFAPRNEPGKFALLPRGDHVMGAPERIRSSAACVGNVPMSDKDWVDKFVQERNVARTEKDETKELKICEARELLRRWLCHVTELINQRDKLIELIKIDESEWKKQLQKAEEVKEKIVKIEATFSNPGTAEKLEKQIFKRRKKRASQETKRKRKLIEKKEAEEKRSLLHKQIDGWRDQVIAKDEALRKAASMKSEAGGVLGEVRRKLTETIKGLEVLKSLKKLRDIRKQEAERKGVYRRPIEGENKYFNERLEYMEKLMTRRKELYEAEQKALEVMLAVEEEEKNRKKKEERRIQQDLFEARDPMEDFYIYYNQADRSLHSLLQIRHQWDMFLVPENVPGASRIPHGWVVPPARPSSELWASAEIRRDITKSSRYMGDDWSRK